MSSFVRIIRLAVFALGMWLAGTAAAQERLAFVLGIGAYAPGSELPNAVNDARLMAEVFQTRGYRVIYNENLGRDDFLRALAQLRLEARGVETVAVYIAAHGMTRGGDHVFLPGDAPVSDAGFARQGIPLRVIVRAISDQPRQKLVLVDACRTLPGLTVVGGDVASVSAAGQAGLHVEFAAQPGGSAYDGAGRTSPFAQAWATVLANGPSDLDTASRAARFAVIRATGGRQIPWSQSSLLRPFQLFGPDAPEG